MSKHPIVLLVGIALLQSACNLAPKYLRPDSPIPEAWPSGKAYEPQDAGADHPTPMTLPWREFYTDPNLAQVIDLALANNRDLRLAMLNVDMARALYGIQRDELLPAAYATGSGGEQRASGDLTQAGQSRNSKHYAVTGGLLSWELDFFGRIRNLKDEALERYLASDEAYRSARILLVSSVANTYLALAADREQLALAESTFEAQQASLQLVRRQYDLGVATELDLRRAQVPVEAARVDMARYTQLVAQDENALRLLLGTSLPETLLPAKLSDIRAPRPLAAGISSEVLLSRPDILAAEHHLKAANAVIGAARSAFFPRISLTGTVGTASDDLSRLFKAGTGTWNYGPQISMPLFDARTWSAHRASKVQRELALTEYEKAIQTAFREVADALAVCGTIEAQVTAQEALVEALAETHRLALTRFEEGVDSYLGVLDAQRFLFDAQKGLVALHLAQRASDIRLYAVLGGGALADPEAASAN